MGVRELFPPSASPPFQQNHLGDAELETQLLAQTPRFGRLPSWGQFDFSKISLTSDQGLESRGAAGSFA